MEPTHEELGLATTRRLLELVRTTFQPGDLARINQLGPARVARRFQQVARLFVGPIPGAQGYSIQRSTTVGVCLVTNPEGAVFAFDPPQLEGPGEWPTKLEVYEASCMATAARATRRGPDAGTAALVETAPVKPAPVLWLVR